jgi:DNA modification methylase
MRTASPDKRVLFPNAQGPQIETRAASPDDPVLRRYVPADDLDAASEFSKLGILDWRERPPTLGDINEVADRIVCADSETALKCLPDNSVDCIITSPPYWNVADYGFEGQLGSCSYEQYLMQLLAVWRECERILVPNGKLCINAPIMPISKKVLPDQHTRHLKNISSDIEAIILKHLSLNRFSLYIWQKQTTEKMFGSYPYPPNLYEQNTIEFINVFVKPGKPKQLPKEIKEKSRVTEKEWMNLTRQVWPLYPEDVKRVNHPAPFPESLPNRLIAMYAFAACPESDPPFPGDLVLDPFNGAGATCLAAKKLGRRFLGIDLSPDFCVAAQRRINQSLPDRKIFLLDHKNDRRENEQEPSALFSPAGQEAHR